MYPESLWVSCVPLRGRDGEQGVGERNCLQSLRPDRPQVAGDSSVLTQGQDGRLGGPRDLVEEGLRLGVRGLNRTPKGRKGIKGPSVVPNLHLTPIPTPGLGDTGHASHNLLIFGPPPPRPRLYLFPSLLRGVILVLFSTFDLGLLTLPQLLRPCSSSGGTSSTSSTPPTHSDLIVPPEGPSLPSSVTHADTVFLRRDLLHSPLSLTPTPCPSGGTSSTLSCLSPRHRIPPEGSPPLSDTVSLRRDLLHSPCHSPRPRSPSRTFGLSYPSSFGFDPCGRSWAVRGGSSTGWGGGEGE